MITVRPLGAASRNPPPRGAVLQIQRKIALCGSHSSSLRDAPWNDPSWEWWGHASSRAWYARPMDRYFDLHPPACWIRGGRKDGPYINWLKSNTVPIYMQQKYMEIPASLEYPKERILLEFSDCRSYFANHIAWMIALALTEGVTSIGLFGVNYSARSEYSEQRGCAEFWLGRAVGKGVRIVLPEQCSLLREPALLYGYESHDEKTGVLKPEYKKMWQPQETIEPLVPGQPVRSKVAIPSELVEQIAAEEARHPRPTWSFKRTDGGEIEEKNA